LREVLRDGFREARALPRADFRGAARLGAARREARRFVAPGGWWHTASMLWPSGSMTKAP
jgi:hypothetical protein